MKALISRIKAFALLLAVAAYGGAWAEAITAVNPVTGATEPYDYEYTGSGTWTASTWQDSDGEPPSNVPQGNPGNFSRLLIDYNGSITASYIEGWTFRIGLFGGADLTVSDLKFWKGSDSDFAVVDEDSKLTISSMQSEVWDNKKSFYVASPGGITWDCNFAPNVNSQAFSIDYYFTGNGRVDYNGSISVCNGTHNILRADATLAYPAAKTVVPKKLIKYGKDDNSVTFKTTAETVVYIDSVAHNFSAGDLPTTTSLSSNSEVGSCELVQKSDGVYLYYVDGPRPESINVNFHHTGAYAYCGKVESHDPDGLQGITEYAVAGKHWKDISGHNGSGALKLYNSISDTSSASSANIAVDSSGANFSKSGFDYKITSGYIDDNTSKPNPLVSFTSIPFDYYRIVVYFATYNNSTMPYGHITVNDYIDLYGSGGATLVGDNGGAGWGGSSPETLTEGSNVLVSPVLPNTSSSTLKILGHAVYSGGNATSKAGIAAIQIIQEGAPSSCTYTVSAAGTYNLFGDSATSYWSAEEPTTGSEPTTIDISGETVLNVNDSRVIGPLSITGSGKLTLTGSGKLVTPSVTIGAGITLVTSSQLSTYATVAVGTGSTFEIAGACTWSGVISGAGGVKVSADTVTFGVANTFTGGLTVANGGHAKTTTRYGFSPQGGSVTVEAGGAIDLGGTTGADESNYALTIAGDGVLVGGVRTGAAYASSDVNVGHKQLASLTLSDDATIKGPFGLIQANYTTATTLTLNGHTLTKAGTGDFIITKTSTSDSTGSIVISGGSLKPYGNKGTDNKNDITCPITIQDGGTLNVSSYLEAANVTCDAGGTVTVTSGNTLSIKNGGTLTANGTVDVEGTGRINIGLSGNAGSHLVVGGEVGEVNVKGAGYNGVGLYLVSTSDITKNGSGMINISEGATVQWINCNWASGDVFRGDGTLFLDGNANQNYSYYATSGFGGILKVGSRAGGTGYYAYFSGNLNNFDTPTLQLACGIAANQGSLRFGQYGRNTTFNVKNLSGYGIVYPWSSQAGTWTINTLQTENTIFDGSFTKYEGAEANSELVVRGNTETSEIKSLTMSGASTTHGAATVQDNAKLIFTDTGSWASGTVNVANGGILEVTNATTFASALDLQSGGTIVISTVNSSVVTLVADSIAFPDSGEAIIDISAIPDLADNEEVSIMTANTSLDSDISALRVVGKPYSLKVDGNALKVVNDGGLVWTADNGWNGKDATKYSEATITASGSTLTLTSNLSFDKLTINGSGEITIGQTGSEVITAGNIVIGSGVTLKASSALNLDSCNISGTGTLKVPSGVTCVMRGVTCSAKVDVHGTLETHGVTELNNTGNIWQYDTGCEFNIEDGTTTIASQSTGDNGLAGTVNIAAGATLANTTTDGLSYYRSPVVVNVRGTLAMGTSRWTIGSGNTINLYEGAEATVTGTLTDNGNLDWKDENCYLNVYGNVNIDANLRARDGGSVVVNVQEDKTLTLKKAFGTSYASGTIIKTGAGTLKLANIPLTCPVAGSEGTVELFNDQAEHVVHSAAGVSFSGTLDFVCTGRNGHRISNAGFLAANATPQLAVNTTGSGNYSDIYAHLFFDHAFNNSTFAVRDLTGEGSVCVKSSGATAQTQTIQSKQTMNTVFSGNMVCNDSGGNAAHTIHLAVIGDGTTDVHDLTLSSENTSIGELSVNDYSRVVFSDTGSWVNGTVTVGADGSLKSDSSATAVAKALVLEDGATLVRGTQPVKVGSGSVTINGDVTVDLTGQTISYDGIDVITASSEAITAETDVSGFSATGYGYNVEFYAVAGAIKVKLVDIIVDDVVVGYMEDDGTAVITSSPASVAIVIPTFASGIEFHPTANSTGFTITTAQAYGYPSTFPIAVKAVMSDSSLVDITGAFAITPVGSGSGTVTLSADLNSSATVDGVSVTPAVDTTTTPMAVDSGAPTFAVKTIPGLWYVVHEGTSSASLTTAGTAVQATSATTNVAGSAPASGVKYYRLAVGVSEAEANTTPAE